MIAAQSNSVVRFGDLLPGLSCPAELSEATVTGLTHDSRQVRSGDVFVALRGATHDGRCHIPAALASGAVAVIAEGAKFDDLCSDNPELMAAVRDARPAVVLVEDLSEQLSALAGRFFGLPGQSLRVFGITGTNGKTTCANLIAQLFSLVGGRCGVIGTLGYGVAEQGELAFTHTGMTTPDAIEVQKILASFRSAGADAAAMEVSSHSLDQHRVDAVGINCAVFTNLSRDHLDYHGSEAAYGAAKERLFHLPGIKTAIVNIEDEFGAGLAERVPDSVEVFRYGFTEGADIRALDLELGEHGLQMTLSTPWGCADVSSLLLGRFNALNLLAAVAAVCAQGGDFEKVIAAIAGLRPVAGRMEEIPGNCGVRVIVDYAHTPDALEKALLSLREHCRGRLWCVFGCGGDRDRGKRPLMASVAEQFADKLVITSDNPRGEDPQAIIADIVAGLNDAGPALVEVGRREAIACAVLAAEAGDTVLIAGKGHENYQQIGDRKLPFSDADEARQILAKRTAATTGGAR